MTKEDIAVAIRDALDLILDNTEIESVFDDFEKIWIETSSGETFLVKVSQIED